MYFFFSDFQLLSMLGDHRLTTVRRVQLKLMFVLYNVLTWFVNIFILRSSKIVIYLITLIQEKFTPCRLIFHGNSELR